MWGELFKIIASAIPAEHRVLVALVVIGAFTGMNTFLVLGLMPAFLQVGIVQQVHDLQTSQQQFVTKSDIQPLAKSLDNITVGLKASRIGTLTTQLYNLRIMHCNAIKVRNFEAAQSHDLQLQDLEYEWRTLTGYDYSRRPCSEL